MYELCFPTQFFGLVSFRNILYVFLNIVVLSSNVNCKKVVRNSIVKSHA